MLPFHEIEVNLQIGIQKQQYAGIAISLFYNKDKNKSNKGLMLAKRIDVVG